MALTDESLRRVGSSASEVHSESVVTAETSATGLAFQERTAPSQAVGRPNLPTENLPRRTPPLLWVSLLLSAAVLACRALSPAIISLPSLTPPPEASLISTGEGMLARLDRLGGTPCPESDFICVTLTVPLDHLDPADGRTIEVVFAVLPAGGDRRGMFVTAVGGPGGSGLAVADTYTAAFDPSITEAFDVVFFDQRGLGASGGQQCVAAAAANYGAEYDPLTAAGETELALDAERFARDCPAEMGNPDLLPYLGTEQAIEDLEVFRRELGDDRFWLYGESYGTQFAQTYAAKYGERLAALILDGPVDLTLSGFEYYAEQAAAFGEVLARTLSACAEDEACLGDMGGDPLQAYDSLAARLRAEPASFEFPLPSGRLAGRSFTFGDLEAGAASYVYSEGSRMLFLRALAASTRGELAPLARIAYDSLSLDPETLAPLVDPGWSDAVSFAVECNDYDYGPAETYLRAGDAVDASVPRLGSVFYGDLPCSFWPEDGFDPGRPEPLVAQGVPVLVLVGTADPATPLPNARRIVERLADSYLVVQEGGPHVVFGWGNACVDNLVTGFLVRDLRPERETSCYGTVIDDYVPLPPADAADFADPLEALASAETEIAYLPEYFYWDGETPFAVGCAFGGTLAVEPSPTGEAYTLSGCAFSRGFEMTGTGAFDYESAGSRLELAVAGLRPGELVYNRDGDGATRVTGEYGGESIDLSR